jgi:hypothetical protein
LPRIGFVSNKPIYEKTHFVSRDFCGWCTLVLYDGGQGTRDGDHDDAYGNRGGTHAHEHEHDGDPAERRRLLSRDSGIVRGREARVRLPFFCAHRCLTPSLGRDFDFFYRLLTNDRGDRLQLLRAAQVH